MFNILYDPTRMLYMVPAIVIGLAFHEFAHGYAAYRLGDKTAYYQGRLTLNPFAHLDIVGTLMIFLAGFGWARPVPINPSAFKGNVNTGIIKVSLAGPAANFITALLASVIYGGLILHLDGDPYYLNIIDKIFMYIIIINLSLGVFNLVPVPPLDGSKILAGMMPQSRRFLYSMEQYGTIILILLLFTGILGKVLGIILSPLMALMNFVISALQ
ncbi:MAG: site-2 protease family protein [Bacillota bacterium]